jgi:adenosylcobinamide-GDP ribazoletransferase
MSESDHFRDALRFLTIVPVTAASAEMQPDWLARSLKYFPTAGICIGLASAMIWLIANGIWGGTIAALLAVAASIVVTGALHEDGLADTMDAFGGGRTIEKRLEIMKDSRIGTYGALALGIGVLLRVAALAELPLWTGVAALIACHGSARGTPAFVMSRMSYTGDAAAMKVAYAEVMLRRDEWQLMAFVIAVAMLPLAFVSIKAALVSLVFGAFLAAALARWSWRLIGGYTGDVLGAIEQVFEIGFLLGVAAILS